VATFILTWNPDNWEWDSTDRKRGIRRTSAGEIFPEPWSAGSRKYGVVPDRDRAFLLRQGPKPRGIVASGVFKSKIGPRIHWDKAKRLKGIKANYAEIDWDRVLGDDDLLPLDDIDAQVGGLTWLRIQSGGVLLSPPADERLEDLWAAHIGTLRPSPQRRQVWQSDPVKRKAVEDHGQGLLERHYRRQGWTVRDTRVGNPYDAIATKRRDTRYLEAKGTETDGLTVRVTSGEVDFARAHPGECVLGVVSDIRFLADGNLDKKSGKLLIHEWEPDAGLLTPRAYDWRPQSRRVETNAATFHVTTKRRLLHSGEAAAIVSDRFIIEYVFWAEFAASLPVHGRESELTDHRTGRPHYGM
jgi:hypothetical protein